MSRLPMPKRVRSSTWRSASSGFRPGSSTCRSTSGRNLAATASGAKPRTAEGRPPVRRDQPALAPERNPESAAASGVRHAGGRPDDGSDGSDLRYTKDHEWVRVDGDEATIGITEYAAGELGDIVFVELPDAGRKLAQHATFGVVESVKAVSDLFAPLSGEVAATNDALAGAPELVNGEPYGGGWMIRIKLADPSEADGLLDAAAYDALIAKG
jgi:glycine cleavage system H protein